MADRCFNRVIRDDSTDGQARYAVAAENRVGVRSGEGSLVLLADDAFTGEWLGFRFELVQRLSGPVVRFREPRVMANVDDRKLTGPPVAKKPGDVLFRGGIVADAPGWVIDRFLHIDDEE